jgi:DNA recombination protein RmuC
VDGADGAVARPDMVVRLAGGKNIVVDSKVTLAAYLEAAETASDDVREQRLVAHARHLRDHVDRLAAKSYWTLLSPAPEFVVLFIPGEAFLAPALERDPGLLEHAMTRRVHIATPTTMVTMLRTAQYAWQQAALSENAKAVFDLGRELYDRLGGLGRHVDGLGKALNGAVSAYNQTVGSLESRVLVSARRLNQLGVTGATLDQPRLIEDSTRPLSAPELDPSGPQLVTGPSAGIAPLGLATPCLADADDGDAGLKSTPDTGAGNPAPRPGPGTLPGQRAVGAAS